MLWCCGRKTFLLVIIIIGVVFAFGSDDLMPKGRTVTTCRVTNGGNKNHQRVASTTEASSCSRLPIISRAVVQQKRGDDDENPQEKNHNNEPKPKDSFLSLLSRPHRRIGSIFTQSSRRAFLQNVIAATAGTVGGAAVAASSSVAPPVVATQETSRIGTTTATTATTAAVTGTSPVALPPVKGNDVAIIDPFLARFLTVNDIPNEYFIDKRSIYGFVERIIDGDTFRVRHIPGFAVTRIVPEPLQQRGIANETLSIRVYAVDTPETGKNKRKTSQPFGQAASDFTSKLVHHKMVKITLLRRDQYGRAVAQVETVPKTSVEMPKDVSIELARNGLAELYTGGGAVYNNNRPAVEAAIAYAQSKKLGIWSLGDNRISAAEYKKAQRDGENAELEAEQPVVVGGGGVPVAFYTNKKTASCKKTVAAAAIASNKKKNDDHVLVAKSTNVPPPKKRGNVKASVAANTMDVVLTGLELFGV